MSQLFYRVVHLTGVLMIFLSLGGVMVHMINGGTREHPWRKPLAITHGLGLLIALIGGFGMLAKMGILASLPGWVIAKISIWLFFGGAVVLMARKPGLNRSLWWVTIALGCAAAVLGATRPF